MVANEIPHGIEAILFDLDGVLVDAADWHRDAFLDSMFDFGLKRLTHEEHEEHYNGLSTRKKLEVWCERNGNPQFVQAFVDDFYRHKQMLTVALIEQRCRPIRRIVDTCEYARSKFKTAVVTNCSRSTCEMMLELSGLSGMFEFIITNEDVDGKVKPHPWPYLKARYRLGLGEKEALAIDDTGRGIMSAVEARCRTWRLQNFEDLSVENLKKHIESYRITL